MRIGLSEVDWGYVGAKFANEDSEHQVVFFKAFLKECLGWGTKYQVEKQLAFINSELTKEEKEALEMLCYNEGD